MIAPSRDSAALIVRPNLLRQIMVVTNTGCFTTLAVLLLAFATITFSVILIVIGLFLAGGAVFSGVVWYAWWSLPWLTADHNGVWARSTRRRSGRFLRWEDILQIYVRPEGAGIGSYRALVVVPRPEVGGLSTVLSIAATNVGEDDLLVRLRTLSNGRTSVGTMP
jgi:hypothetical protein